MIATLMKKQTGIDPSTLNAEADCGNLESDSIKAKRWVEKNYMMFFNDAADGTYIPGDEVK